MPNWISTKIKFSGDEKQISAVLSKIKGDKEIAGGGYPWIDFNKLIPMPENIYKGNLGMAEREKYGEDNWYDWSVENWGTKWNASDAVPSSVVPNEYEYYMDTAWSFPTPIIEKLSEFCIEHEVSFEGAYADEDCGSNTGRFVGGYEIKQVQISYNENCTSEAYKTYIDIRGASLCIGQTESGEYTHYECETCPNKDDC